MNIIRYYRICYPYCIRIKFAFKLRLKYWIWITTICSAHLFRHANYQQSYAGWKKSYLNSSLSSKRLRAKSSSVCSSIVMTMKAGVTSTIFESIAKDLMLELSFACSILWVISASTKRTRFEIVYAWLQQQQKTIPVVQTSAKCLSLTIWIQSVISFNGVGSFPLRSSEFILSGTSESRSPCGKGVEYGASSSLVTKANCTSLVFDDHSLVIASVALSLFSNLH